MERKVHFGFVAGAAGAAGTSDAQMYADMIDDCQRNSALGYRSAWVIEHHFSDYYPTPSPLLLLSHLAGRFPELELGTCVLVLPWHDPLRIAEDIAMLSVIADRPIHLGLGRGTAKYEYDAFGVDMGTSRERFRECWELVTTALAGEKFRYRGAHVDMNKQVRLRPEVDTHNVRFYGAIGSPDSARIMAGLGLGPICTSVGGLDRQVMTLDSWRAVATEHGLSPEREFPLMINCIVADTDELAIAEAQHHIPDYMRAQIAHYAPDETNWQRIKSYEGWRDQFERMKQMTHPENVRDWAEGQLIGSPETVRRKVEGLAGIGFDHFVLQAAIPGVPAADRQRWLQRFATEVMPAFSPGASQLSSVGA